ncbi:MAG: hypothetical protein B6U75_00155 [Desulfurococcales archaeon ex4484_217_1]|nr:MAG: hypothetical protein B6U75_00155 [Desulfurococcales archaeon ex4484_217_1]
MESNKVIPYVLITVGLTVFIYISGIRFLEYPYYLVLLVLPTIIAASLMMIGKGKFGRLLSIRFRGRNIKDINDFHVEENIAIIPSKDVYKGAVVYAVSEIPYTFADVSQSFLLQQIRAFTNFIVASEDNTSLLLIKKSGDVRKYIRNLERTITNYKVLLSADPANPYVQRKLQKLETLFNRISRGETPVNVKMYLVATAQDKNVRRLYEKLKRKGETLSSTFKASLGLELKRASEEEVLEAITHGLLGESKPITVLESNLGFLTPIGYVKRPKISGGGIFIGEDIDYGTLVFYDFEKYLTKHMVIVGPTGRGKTTLLYTIAKRVIGQYDVPIWVLDLRGEFIGLSKTIGVSIVDPEKTPVNLMLPWFTSPRLRAKQLVDLIKALTDLEPAEEYILYMSILKSYERTQHPNLETLISIIKEEKSSNPELELKFYTLLTKIEQLNSKVFLGSNYNNVFSIVKKPVIFALYKLPEEYRKVYALAILQILTNYMLTLTPTNKLRHLVLIDEAWRLTDTKSSSKIVRSLVKEGRGYGLAVALASQDITDFPKDVLDNAGTIIVFGSNSKDYIEAVAKYMKLNEEEKERMTWLKTGEALIRITGDPRPIWVKIIPENMETRNIITKVENR